MPNKLSERDAAICREKCASGQVLLASRLLFPWQTNKTNKTLITGLENKSIP